MSQEERDKLEWLKRAKDKVISQREAAQTDGSQRPLGAPAVAADEARGRRVWWCMGCGDEPRTGRSPPRSNLVRWRSSKQPEWDDFGPTFASEQLANWQYGIQVSDETVRRWMMDAGLWQKRAASREEVHCWRPRRSAFGELVQWDTSEHDWLEGRGPVRYLVRLIDDATSWSWGRFVESDATPWNMGVLWEYLDTAGADAGRVHGPGFDVRDSSTERREPNGAASRRIA